jgi:hypothetical protein
MTTKELIVSLHDEIAKATVESVRSSLMRHMPASLLRDYYVWGISKENPHRDDFLQMVGINQLINLSSQMIGDLILRRSTRSPSRVTISAVARRLPTKSSSTIH